MQNFVLVGPHAGKTITLGGHQFVDGVFSFGPSPEGIMPSAVENTRKAALLAKLYQAYPEGSPELEAATTRLDAGEPEEGRLNLDEREIEDQGKLQPAGAGGSDRARQGAVRTALTKLDPKNDEHWTDGGLPAVAAVRELSGGIDASRQDINALAPKLTREEAAKLAGDAGEDPLD